MDLPPSRMRKFENRRVRMRFDDGVEIVARLLSAVEDFDGSQHWYTTKLNRRAIPLDGARSGHAAMYAAGESLIDVEGL